MVHSSKPRTIPPLDRPEPRTQNIISLNSQYKNLLKTAVLLTSFNRKEKTKACLENLFNQKLPQGIHLEVFLCDDSSTDGTSQMIQYHFPQVNLTYGTGHLYWGGGMRKAWELSKTHGHFDFFLWLNDDTILYPNALLDLWEEYSRIPEKPGILLGACAIPGTEKFAYGGHNESLRPMPPNGALQKVTYMNGNLVLIPNEIEVKLGMISSNYTHYLGDFDYSMRAQEAGFSCYSSSSFLAECHLNELPYWADPTLTFWTRWKLAHSIKGLALEEYIYFKSYHWGKWIGFKSRIEVYLKLIFPHSYVEFRKFLSGKKAIDLMFGF